MGSVGEALGAATTAFEAAGVEEARFDAEVLLQRASGWDRARLAASPETEIPGGTARRFAEMVRRRVRREPVAYIVGARWFRGIELAVDPRVLIPRPETELLVELALELKPATMLDVGTGSGAVALAVAAELPGCEVTACDTSEAALTVARGNAERLSLAARVRFLAGSTPAGEAFDLTVANLPYVAAAEWPSLQPEVRDWEPREALLGGADGLDAIRSFLADLGARGAARDSTAGAGPAVGRAVALEVGAGQAEPVVALMRDAGLRSIAMRRDLAGIERVVWGRL